MSITHRIAALAVATGFTLAGFGVTAGAAYASRSAAPRTDSCSAHLTAPGSEGVTLASSPAEVLPGGTVTATGQWDAAGWDQLDRILFCVTTDGDLTPGLSGAENPADDGELAWSFTVPAATAAGTELCVRGILFGTAIDAPDIQLSPFSCARVATAAPSTTATPTPEPDVTVEAAAEGPAPDVAVLSLPEPADIAVPEAVPALPRTGAAPVSLALTGAAFLLVGGAGLVAGRRRPPSPARH
jgi:LPXTG-motif cell wall-anchored protein